MSVGILYGEKNEKIAIYGTGWNAIKFIFEHRLDNVEYFIEERKEMKEFYGKPVVRLEEALEKQLNRKIIVASSENTYFEIKDILEKQGLIEFEDFVYYELYHKKVALIYGNCHTMPIKEALLLVNEFSREYAFYPLRQIQEMKRYETKDYELPVFQYCDLFIHQSIREDNSYGKEYGSNNLVKKLKSSCKIIAIPNLYGLPKCLFPQVYESETVRHGDSKQWNFSPFRDKYIDQSYSEQRSISSITRGILEGDVFDKNDICGKWEMFLEKVKKRENDWDFKITDFIVNSYKKEQLFFDPNHPTSVVIKFITREILKILSINGLADEAYLKIAELDAYEIPIYADVRKALHLEWKSDFLRKYSKHRLSNAAMDVEEYVKQYIKWNFYLCNKK